MKVVIDTSVVVSAVLRDRTPKQIMLFVTRTPDIEWIASQGILDEYAGALPRPKFALPQALVHEWQELFSAFVKTIDVPSDIHFPRDQKDAKFLACALAAAADYLITSDQDFAEAQALLQTKIYSVSEFRRLFLDESP